MGRKKLGNQRMNMSLPPHIVAKMHFYLTDPERNRLKSGVVSSITASLWQKFFNYLEHPNTDTIAVLKQHGIVLPQQKDKDTDNDTVD